MSLPKNVELEPLLREDEDFYIDCVKRDITRRGIDAVPISRPEVALVKEIGWWLFIDLNGKASSTKVIDMDHIAASGLALAKRANQIVRQTDQPGSLVPASISLDHEVYHYYQQLVEPADWSAYIKRHPITVALADRLPTYLPEFQPPNETGLLEVNRFFWNRAVEIGFMALDQPHQLTRVAAQQILANSDTLDAELTELTPQ